ncbi:MAG: twin-arginine translocase TatA/TatE family subunit [Planctomycetes bacterium]|nr:twin-arginine translocase TatA/TatE family subunit [Planctomycetota bacterium]MBL7040463.1 twin-arginine translocase TatA/TatE family subunit [Pirellulaceae bacterium]
MTTLFAFFGFPGHIEAIIVLAVILLLFGHRLPGMMRSMGRSVVEFKKGIREPGDDEEDDDEPAISSSKESGEEVKKVEEAKVEEA